MGKDAHNEDLDLPPAVEAKFRELVELLSRQGFGESGPPLETTFAEIEKFGHQTGRMLARALDAHLTARHALHFTGVEPCPTCHEPGLSHERSHALPLQTSDGEVVLHEPACHCPSCRRDFFPAARRVTD
jgi:hypothetical protein